MDWSQSRKRAGRPRKRTRAGAETRLGLVRRKSLGVVLETKAGRKVPGKPEAGRKVPEPGHRKRSAGVLRASQTGEGTPNLGRTKDASSSPRRATLSRSPDNRQHRTALVPMLMTTRLRSASLLGPRSEASSQRDRSPSPLLPKPLVSLLTSSLPPAVPLSQTTSSPSRPGMLPLIFNSLRQLLLFLKPLPQTSQQPRSQPGKLQLRSGDSPTPWPL